jgi:hypothetical protein
VAQTRSRLDDKACRDYSNGKSRRVSTRSNPINGGGKQQYYKDWIIKVNKKITQLDSQKEYLFKIFSNITQKRTGRPRSRSERPVAGRALGCVSPGELDRRRPSPYQYLSCGPEPATFTGELRGCTSALSWRNSSHFPEARPLELALPAAPRVRELEIPLFPGKAGRARAISLFPPGTFWGGGFVKGLRPGATEHYPKLIPKFPEDKVFSSTITAAYHIIEIEVVEFTPIWHYNELELAVITVDKTELEKLVRICQIKFKILRGYYWSSAIEPLTDYYYQELCTKRQSATNPKYQLGYKKMLNCLYGKPLSKPQTTKVMIHKTESKFIEAYRYYRPIVKNFRHTKEGWRLVLGRCFDRTYNLSYFGVGVKQESQWTTYLNYVTLIT